MRHRGTFVALAALGTVAFAEERPGANAREAVEGYVAAALAGKVDDAAASAVKGQSPAAKKRVEELRKLVGAKALKITTAFASPKDGQAIAVSEPVKLTRANP